MSEETQLSTLGNLEPKIANMLCYLPIMSINLIASIAFMVTEEKENYRIRFHAAQGLLVVASVFVAAIVYVVLSVILSVGAAIIDGILATDGLLSLLGGLANLLLMLVFLAYCLIVPFGATVLAFLEKGPRIPIMASLADKIVGGNPEAA